MLTFFAAWVVTFSLGALGLRRWTTGSSPRSLPSPPDLFYWHEMARAHDRIREEWLNWLNEGADLLIDDADLTLALDLARSLSSEQPPTTDREVLAYADAVHDLIEVWTAFRDGGTGPMR